jgi:plastocyanin
MRLLVLLAFAALSSTASAQAIPVTLSEWKMKLGRDTVPAGKITFQIKNEGTMTHGFFVRGNGVQQGSPDIPVGQSGTLSLTLKPGSYTVYCPLADLSHRKAGMLATLVVTGAAPAAATKPPAGASR